MTEPEPARSRWARLAILGTASVHEAAGGIGALPAAIGPIWDGARLCGPARTVETPPGDNLWIHRALARCEPGEVLVVACGDGYEFGYWGDLLATAAVARGLGGLVIDGCVRDGDRLREVGLPTFGRGRSIRGTTKAPGGGGHDRPIRIGEVVVRPGDVVHGDGDGVVVVPAAALAEVVGAAEQRDDAEAAARRVLAAGTSTLEHYGWDDPPVAERRPT